MKSLAEDYSSATFTVMSFATRIEPSSASVVAQAVAYVLAGQPKNLREVFISTGARLEVVADDWRRFGNAADVSSFLEIGDTITKLAGELKHNGEKMTSSRQFGTEK